MSRNVRHVHLALLGLKNRKLKYALKCKYRNYQDKMRKIKSAINLLSVPRDYHLNSTQRTIIDDLFADSVFKNINMHLKYKDITKLICEYYYVTSPASYIFDEP